MSYQFEVVAIVPVTEDILFVNHDGSQMVALERGRTVAFDVNGDYFVYMAEPGVTFAFGNKPLNYVKTSRKLFRDHWRFLCHGGDDVSLLGPYYQAIVNYIAPRMETK